MFLIHINGNGEKVTEISRILETFKEKFPYSTVFA